MTTSGEEPMDTSSQDMEMSPTSSPSDSMEISTAPRKARKRYRNKSDSFDHSFDEIESVFRTWTEDQQVKALWKLIRQIENPSVCGSLLNKYDIGLNAALTGVLLQA